MRRRPMRVWAAGIALLLARCASGGEEHAPAGGAAGSEAREAAAPSEVHLSEEAIRGAGIEVAPVTRRPLASRIRAVGVIRPISSRLLQVKAVATGRVVSMAADVGDHVRKGQRLATIESPDAGAALARYRAAAARQTSAERSLDRAGRLVAARAMSQAEMDRRRADVDVARSETDAARQDLERLGLPVPAAAADTGTAPAPSSAPSLAVTAPLSGVVLQRTASEGLLVERGEPLLEIADLTVVWATADLYEKDLGAIADHGEAEVAAEAFPGEIFTGRIDRIEPQLDERSRTVGLRVALDNPGERLRPGLFVTVALPVREAAVPALAVPADAVQSIAGSPAVFVQRGPGLFEMRPVEKGRQEAGWIEITHGLQDGEPVAMRGAFLLKSELLKGSIEGEGD